MGNASRLLHALAATILLPLVAGCAIAEHPIGAGDRPWVTHAPADDPRAVILALHGFNDYSGAFDEFAAFAVDHGYRLEAFDQQGFGANRNRGLWPGNEALATDLRGKVERLRADWPATPLFILGESMGAAVATIALANRGSPGEEPLVDGLIMAAPAVWGGDAFNPFYRAVLMTTAALLPRLEVTGRGLERRASDNDAALLALGRDPFVIKATRLDAVAGLVQLMDEAVAKAPDLDLPVLLLLGERDEIIPPEVILAFAARLGEPSCDLVVYPDGWHLLLRDLQRERVWNDIVAWLEGEPPAEAVACNAVL
jgi:alpha-beta hydrolase superfamily lysophospholipase